MAQKVDLICDVRLISLYKLLMSVAFNWAGTLPSLSLWPSETGVFFFLDRFGLRLTGMSDSKEASNIFGAMKLIKKAGSKMMAPWKPPMSPIRVISV